MQIPKSLLVICATATSLSLTALAQVADSDEHAKARQALRERLQQLEIESAEPESIVRARQALREKLSQLEAASPPESDPSGITITMDETPMPPADPAAVEKAREVLRQKLWELERGAGEADTPELAKAREALRQKLAQLESQPPVSDQGQQDIEKQEAAAAAQRRTKRAQALRPTEYEKLPAPESPLKGDKQARLAELLRQYRADQLTPEQYHAQRAKIIAEP